MTDTTRDAYASPMRAEVGEALDAACAHLSGDALEQLGERGDLLRRFTGVNLHAGQAVDEAVRNAVRLTLSIVNRSGNHATPELDQLRAWVRLRTPTPTRRVRVRPARGAAHTRRTPAGGRPRAAASRPSLASGDSGSDDGPSDSAGSATTPGVVA